MADASELESLRVVANDEAYSFTLDASAAAAGIQTIDLSDDDNATGDNTVDVSAYGVATTLTGSAGADSITGGTGADSITGAGGDDTLSGGAGADMLDGGAGNNVFVFGATNELFTGTALVDTIIGGTGSDTLLLGTAGAAFSLGADVVFAATNARGLESLTVVANSEAYNLALHESAATAGIATIDLSSDSTATGAANTVDVSAYTTQAVSVLGSAGADMITGGGGVDTLNGGAGSDTFVFGSEAELFTSNNALEDSIVGGTGTTDTDTLLLGTAGTAFTIANTLSFARARELESLTVVANTAAYSLTLNADALTAGIVTIDLSGDDNATGVNTVDVSTYGVATTLTGSEGDDVITGGTGADSITGGAGVDTLSGGAGNDSFIYASSADFAVDSIAGGANVDSLVFSNGTADITTDIVLTGVSFSRANDLNRIAIENSSANNSITLGTAQAAITTIDLSGDNNTTGTNTVDVSALSSATTLTGSAGTDMLTGGGGADNIAGGGGNDSLIGGAGVDTLNGGAGSDTFIFGSQAELFTGNALADNIVGGDTADTGIDTLLLGTVGTAFTIANTNSFVGASELESLTVVANIQAYSLTLNATAEAAGIRVIDLSNDNNAAGGNTINVFAFSSDTTLTGSVGADTITGGTGADNITGGGSADTLIGGAGNDSFIYASYADFIADSIAGGTDVDSLVFSNGTADIATAITLTEASFARTSGLNRIAIRNSSANNSITLATTQAPITMIDLSGDSNATGDNTIDVSDYGVSTTLTGSAGADTITGGADADILNGGAGSDTFVFGSASDLFTGTSLMDTIVGGDTADTGHRHIVAGHSGDSFHYCRYG